MSVAKTIAAADRPTPRLTRADALLFRDRWQAVAEFEAQERRAASLDLLWQQTEAIWDFASLMGWLVRGADTQAELDRVRARWTKLYESRSAPPPRCDP
ncbi:hypothetical protein [Candidatus Amarolinea dominans]|uniref:hypothetical protein n=1 Tax=Candidatus Amarolinea dominans TaxID=3140696 RepID=UPI0031360CB9|nr:hypothetical protein [Anaerolineae bacterium]